MPEPHPAAAADAPIAPMISVRFLCLARDCAATLPAFFEWLETLAGAGIAYSALIGENGSSDNTRALLEAAAGPRFEVLDTGFMQAVPGRLARMATGRQALLDAARERRGGEAFVCVADLDNVMQAPPPAARVREALDLLAARPELFAVGATSAPFYYDILSLQGEGHDYRTLNAEIAAAKGKLLGYYRFHRDRIYANQRRATQAHPVLCASSFNGFCLYVAELYYQGSYRAPDEADVCEHISLNLSIGRISRREMMILPELQLRTPGDHGPVSFVRFWADRLRKLL